MAYLSTVMCPHNRIFSDKAGALGSFAAAADFAFGTIIQRVMDSPAHVRMHYGHPDVFNKVHCMTRVSWRGGGHLATSCAKLIGIIHLLNIIAVRLPLIREVCQRPLGSCTYLRMSLAVTITR